MTARPSQMLRREPELPPHGIPREPPDPRLRQALPPFGPWVLHDAQPSRAGYHVRCPACLTGRVLLAPDPDDDLEYLFLPGTCSAGCDPYDVMRWWAFREGDPGLWFDWLQRQRARTRRAA